MSDLLQAVLTDPLARTNSSLPMVAASAAEEFAPWASA